MSSGRRQTVAERGRTPGAGVKPIQVAPAFALAWAAGGVDAIGFLTLFHLFTAHMSGNSAATGAYLGQHDWAEGLRRAFPVPVFVAGVALGSAVVESGLRRKVARPLLATLGLECALIAVFLIWGRDLTAQGSLRGPSGGDFFALTALPTLAMGVQNAVLRRVGPVSVRTTYVTGMLTNFAEKGVALCFWLRDRTRGRGRRRLGLALRVFVRRPELARMGLFGGIWVSYIWGAYLSSEALGHWGLYALLLPLACLLCLIAADLRAPLRVESLQ